jgi:hypothetical protein
VLGQGEHGSQPELQTPGYGIIARFDDVGDIAGEMGEAGLMRGGVPLLGGVAIRDPHRRPMPVHHLSHHDSAPRRRRRVHHRAGRVEHPVKGIATSDPDANLV